MIPEIEKLLGGDDKRYIRVVRLLELIDGANKSIEMSQSESESMVKQYEHLKKKYVEELREILKEYKIPFQLKDAA